MKLAVLLETANDGSWTALTEILGSFGLKTVKYTMRKTASRNSKKTVATAQEARFVRFEGRR